MIECRTVYMGRCRRSSQQTGGIRGNTLDPGLGTRALFEGRYSSEAGNGTISSPRRIQGTSCRRAGVEQSPLSLVWTGRRPPPPVRAHKTGHPGVWSRAREPHIDPGGPAAEPNPRAASVNSVHQFGRRQPTTAVNSVHSQEEKVTGSASHLLKKVKR